MFKIVDDTSHCAWYYTDGFIVRYLINREINLAYNERVVYNVYILALIIKERACSKRRQVNGK